MKSKKKKIRQASCFLDEVLEHLYAQASDAVRKSSMEQLNEVANIKLYAKPNQSSLSI